MSKQKTLINNKCQSQDIHIYYKIESHSNFVSRVLNNRESGVSKADFLIFIRAFNK